MGRVLVTGAPGAGKTTLVQRVADRLVERGQPVAGFVTHEIRRGGRRTGFVVTGLSSGLERTLAVAGAAGPQVGRYGVDVESFEQVALPELHAGLELGSVIVVDEIGKMELLSESFVAVLPEVFDAERVLATVHAHRHPVTDELKRRPEMRLVRVGAGNRDDLAELIERSVIGDVRT